MCENKFNVQHYVLSGWSQTQTVTCGWFKSDGTKYLCNDCLKNQSV